MHKLAYPRQKIPELIFLPDNSLEYSMHIDEIIANLPKPAQQDEEEESKEGPDEN